MKDTSKKFRPMYLAIRKDRKFKVLYYADPKTFKPVVKEEKKDC